HGKGVEEVHFHEVGAVDAIIDITGAAIAIETLGISQIYASPLPFSSGHVQTTHGVMPVPAPATLEILRQVSAPWKPSTAAGEILGGMMDRLLAAGALDISYTPIQMKKNRPAVMVTVICQEEEGHAMASLLLSESSTLGVRISQVQRLKAQRIFERIETPIGR